VIKENITTIISKPPSPQGGLLKKSSVELCATSVSSVLVLNMLLHRVPQSPDSYREHRVTQRKKKKTTGLFQLPRGVNPKGLNTFSFLLILLLVFQKEASAQKKQVTFREVSKQAGIDFKYTIGYYSYVNILESSGSGITVFDYNNDNLMDIFMMNGTYIEGVSDPDGKVFKDSPDALYRNNGNGTFTDVAKESGINDRYWSMAAGAVDYDSDGDQDLYLLNYGPNVFFRNNGNGTFTDITESL
jgi:hypothetical protein